MNKNWILHNMQMLCIILITSSIRSEGTNEPLIFNPFSLDIYDLESIASSPHDGDFAVACPAEDADELRLNKNNALDHRALFVRDFLKKDDPKLLEYRCKERYYMFVVYHKVENLGRLLEFGYEIYYSSDQIHEGIIHNEADLVFGRAEEVNSMVKRFYRGILKDFLSSSKKAFVWIPKVQFQYIRSEWNVKWISYYMNLKTDQLQASCTNFNLGFRLYNLHQQETQTLDDFYSTTNQAKIFNEFEIPKYVYDTCKSKDQCLEEYNLVAPYRFQASIKEPVIECSNLTSIPVWSKRTKELLDYTEKFIIAFSETVGNKVEVLTGVHGELTFLPKNQKKPKRTPIYLDWENRRLSIPRIIYKIVSSKTDDCDPQKSICQHDVAIIIHNEPEMHRPWQICEDVCDKWGWKSIQYLTTNYKWRYEWEKSDFIYCCELDEELQKELLTYRENPIESGYLNLKCVENYKPRDDSQKPSKCTNIRTKVENKMNDLFGSKS